MTTLPQVVPQANRSTQSRDPASIDYKVFFYGVNQLDDKSNLGKLFNNAQFTSINFWKDVLDKYDEFKFMFNDSWRTGTTDDVIKILTEAFPAVRHYAERNYDGYVVQNEEYVLLLSYQAANKSLNFTFVGISQEKCNEIHKTLRTLFPVDTYIKENEKINLKFWYNTPRGASNTVRKIDVPAWEKIKTNYNQVVQNEMERLVALKSEDINGKLIIWYGTPGSGKTYGIRALAWEWRKWASFEYITDPEAFLGDPNYMLTVGVADDYVDYDAMMEDEDLGIEQPEENYKKWKVLILEDSGELITHDAKERNGQSLSRLLNMVDGLIGQGLNLMVLITTNEPVESLHRATSRAGRSLSVREFPALTKDECNNWFEGHNSDFKVNGAASLADLYAKLDNPDHVIPTQKSSVGFRS